MPSALGDVLFLAVTAAAFIVLIAFVYGLELL
jgi:hypothetical protein